MKYRIKVILAILLSIGVVSIFLYVVVKNIDHREGIEGKERVYGT